MGKSKPSHDVKSQLTGTRDAVETAIDLSKDNLSSTWDKATGPGKARISRWAETTKQRSRDTKPGHHIRPRGT